MPFWGPWEQPADITYTRQYCLNGTSDTIYRSDIVVPEGSPAPDPASSWAHPSSGVGELWIQEKVERVHGAGTTEWLREYAFAAADLSSLDLSSPGPTPAERANPHYVGWEAEAPVGIIHYPATIELDVTIGGILYTDDLFPKDPLSPPDIMDGYAQLRRVPPSAYSVDAFNNVTLTPDVWTYGGAWPVFWQEPLLQDKTVTVSGGDGYTDNTLEADPDTTFVTSASYAETDLDDGYRIPLLSTLSRWVAGDVLIEPDVQDPPPPGHGFTSAFKGGLGGAFLVQATPYATLTFTPPRYRILYDELPYQRSYPRPDALGAGSARSWPPPSTRQSSPRSVPAAIF